MFHRGTDVDDPCRGFMKPKPGVSPAGGFGERIPPSSKIGKSTPNPDLIELNKIPGEKSGVITGRATAP